MVNYFDTLEEYQKSLDLPVSNNGLQINMARILATKFKSENEVNRIFSNIRHDFKSYIAWAQLALYFENFDKVRYIYQQASKKPLENSDLVYQEWIDFEMVYGSSENIQKCLSQVWLAKEKNASRQKKELDENHPVGINPSQIKEKEEKEKEEVEFKNISIQKKRVREEDILIESDAKKIKKEENRKIGDFTSYKVIPKYFSVIYFLIT